MCREFVDVVYLVLTCYGQLAKLDPRNNFSFSSFEITLRSKTNVLKLFAKS